MRQTQALARWGKLAADISEWLRRYDQGDPAPCATENDIVRLLGLNEIRRANLLRKLGDSESPLPKGIPSGSKPEPLLSVKDVAQRLGVHDSFVYEAARSGKLEVVKVGKYRRFTEEAVSNYLKKYGGKPKVL